MTPPERPLVILSAAKNPEGLDEVNLKPQSTKQEMLHFVQHDKEEA